MCTFLLLLFVSRLVNGMTMGNKTSKEENDGNNMCSEIKKNVTSICCPDEGYRPMSTKMRNDLLQSRRVRRIAPNAEVNVIKEQSGSDITMKKNVSFPDILMAKGDTYFKTAEGNKINVMAACTEDFDQADRSRTPFTTEVARLAETESNESRDLTTYGVTSSVGQEAPNNQKISQKKIILNVKPIVTVFNPIERDEKSNSLPNNIIEEEDEIAPSQNESTLRKSHVVNRQYSLIDIQTGLTKSEFTLDLEEKLRQSKRELGFDNHWNGWKEFSYRVETPRENGMRNRSIDKQIMVNKVEKRNEDGVSRRSNASVEYCTHNCQIFGLRNVDRPDVMANKTEVLSTMFPKAMDTDDGIRKMYKTHCRKESCPCDLCTLSFLTDMNCHGGGCARYRSRNSLSSPERSMKTCKEKIRITDNKFGGKSIEVSVRSTSSETNGSSMMCSSSTSTDTKPDCTNIRIRNKFKENDLAGIREIYTNPKSTYNEVSVEELPAKDFAKFSQPLSPPRRPTVYKSESNKFNQKTFNGNRKISTSTVSGGCTSTSSMSTILSYRRVRQIFQTIIEGRRVRRRAKADIMKFKEMEELGLGKFHNNRWYPSEHKTLSIWQDLNESAHGLQGEFKKYQKTK